MIVAITIILIVAMICGTILTFVYWTIIHEEVNEYTLRDVKELEKEIQKDTSQIKVDIKNCKNCIKNTWRTTVKVNQYGMNKGNTKKKRKKRVKGK